MRTILEILRPTVECREGLYVILSNGGSSPTKADLADWMKELGDDPARVEEVVNHRHIADFAICAGETLDVTELTNLGRLYRASLSDLLAEQFPGMSFQVQMSGDGDLEADAFSLEVTFFRSVVPHPT